MAACMPATSRATAGEAADLIRSAIILLRPASFCCGQLPPQKVTSMVETLLDWITNYGAISLFFLMMLGIIGLPVPDETLLVFSGYLIFKGKLHPAFTFSMAFLGSVTGITVSYFLGRVYGLKLIHKYGRYFHITEERYQKVHNWFERIGRWSLFFGYYIAGVRHFTAMLARASNLE